MSDLTSKTTNGASAARRIASCFAMAALLLPAAAHAQDSDGDGVLDVSDVFPCDASAIAGAWAPARDSHGVVLFEDQWPARGDFDFNDVVVSYRYEARLDASGKATSLLATFNPLALGGELSNGLGLTIPVPRASVSGVRRRVDGGAFGPANPNLDVNLTVDVSSNLRELFGGATGQINSRSDLARQVGATVDIEITFTAPIALDLGAAPFDLFIFRANDRTHEVHLPEFAGSALVDGSRFGTGDDASSGGRYFVNGQGVPFALHIPATAQTDDGSVVVYPLEATDITSLFTRLVLFASSGGVDGNDYYVTGLDAAKGFVDVMGQAAPAPRLANAPLSCMLLPAVPTPVAFVTKTNATPGATYASEAVTLTGFTGNVDVSVDPGFSIIESYDLDACLNDLLPPFFAARIIADPSSYIAGRGYADEISFVAGECPTRLVTTSNAVRAAGDTVQLIGLVAGFGQTATTQLRTAFGDVFGSWSITAPADLTNFYISQGATGDCSTALAACDLATATQHAALGDGDRLLLLSDVSVASLTLSKALTIESATTRRKLSVTGNFQLGSGTLGPTTFDNIALEYSSSATVYGTTITARNSTFTSMVGHQYLTFNAGTPNQTTRYGIDVQNCAFVSGQLSLSGINDLTLDTNTFTDVTIRINEATNTQAGRTQMTIRNNDVGGMGSTGRNNNYVWWVYIHRDADITYENNTMDATGYFGGMRFHMWQGALSLFVRNNDLLADSFGFVMGTQAPTPSGQTQFVCVEYTGNTVSTIASFTSSGSDLAVSEMQVEGWATRDARNTVAQWANGLITDVAPGTCAAR